MNVAPLYSSPFHAAGEGTLVLGSAPRPNFHESFVEQLAGRMGVKIGQGGVPKGFTPEDIFHYAYAVFHSPGYRSRFAEFLKIDFPRLPLTGSPEMFRALARLGGQLVFLHLMESPALDRHITGYVGPRSPEVEKVSYARKTVWLDKGQTCGFRGVPEGVWNFHIGGYRVCEKWLKDRKGRTLSKYDIAHYHKIVVALSETIRLMKEIDKVIEAHGGWPGAFTTNNIAEQAHRGRFDRKPASETPWTKTLWIYDFRTNQHFTLKTNPLRREHLDEFVSCYNPENRFDRKPVECFRPFDYAELLKRDKVNLDIFWLKDESLEDSSSLPDPDIIAAEIAEDLEAALDQFSQIAADLRRT